MFTNTSAASTGVEMPHCSPTDLESLTDAAEFAVGPPLPLRRLPARLWIRVSGRSLGSSYELTGSNPGQLPFNSGLDYAPLLRAALDNLDRWIAKGEEPPASRSSQPERRYCGVESHTLLEPAVRPAVASGVKGTDPESHQGVKAGYGQEAHLGRTTRSEKQGW